MEAVDGTSEQVHELGIMFLRNLRRGKYLPSNVSKDVISTEPNKFLTEVSHRSLVIPSQINLIEPSRITTWYANHYLPH